jgi:hypothetical protein
MKILLISLSVLLLLPNFLNITIEKEPGYNRIELFDPSLSRINSVQKLINYADSISENKFADTSLQYALIVGNVLRDRFFHGFSTYSFKQNWIAATTQYFLGHDVANPVNADDILLFPYAGCSQQAIVLFEVMKRKGINFRSLGFPHHYATELQFNNSWYYFDPNMEPKMNEEERNVKNWKHSIDSLKKYYHQSPALLNWGFGNSLMVSVGEINAKPAPKADLFQTITKYASRFLWLFPLLIVAYPCKRKA